MIELKNINKIYGKSEKKAVNDFSYSFPECGLIGIFGRSGCGKTTLLNILSGLICPTEGEIFFRSLSIKNPNYNEWKKIREEYLSIIFQDGNLFKNLTVEENILVASSVKMDEEKMDDILEQLEIKHYKKQRVSELSGGERQRVAIARALARGSKVIVADEPTNSLDYENAIKVFQILKKISSDILVIVVSHDWQMVLENCDQIIHLEKGKMVKVEEKTKVIKNEIKEQERSNVSINHFSILQRRLFSKQFYRRIFSSFFFVLAISLMLITISLTWFDKDHFMARELSKGSNQIFISSSKSDIIVNKDLQEEDYPYVKEQVFLNLYLKFFLFSKVQKHICK